MITRFKLKYKVEPQDMGPVERYSYTYSTYGYIIERERVLKLLTGGILSDIMVYRLGWRGWRVVETW